MFKQITKSVWVLSFISLFNDFSSEMLYPILPLYFAQIGYGSLFIGFLEGIAECIGGLLKIYSGSLSDAFQKRLPFIQTGYALSILSRPLMGFFSNFGAILSARILDKIGKGIRTGARDALLADESNEKNSAEVFGFHRSMDTLGAVFGPLVALLFLYFYPENYKGIFLFTLIPGVIAIFFTFLIKEKKRTQEKIKLNFKDHFSYYKKAPQFYKKFISIFLLFALVNSSDMFLLLQAKEKGIDEKNIILLYLIFNLSFALFAFPIGKLADKFGKQKMLLISLAIFSITYLLFPFAATFSNFILLFSIYGLFYAFNQGVFKAKIVALVAANEKSSAIGLYDGLNSFALLFSNFIGGLIWYKFGSTLFFLYTGIITFLVFLFLIFFTLKNNKFFNP